MAKVARNYLDWRVHGILGWEVSRNDLSREETPILDFSFWENIGVGEASGA